MGTSSAYGGPNGGTPLVPSWLAGDGADTPDASGSPDGGAKPDGQASDSAPPAPPPRPFPPVPQDGRRFTAARSNFSRFARSGGSDLASLGRAVAQYVSTSSGGSARAARRMGSSRIAGGRLLGFLSDAEARGSREALQTLNLDGLVGRPIEEIFLGLADYVCPESGTVDEGISRDAFIETIADLADLGVTDLDALTADHVRMVFEIYATHAIEARILNDIGTKTVMLPSDVHSAERVQAQLSDFVRRGVSDALSAAQTDFQALTPGRVLDFVGNVYEAAFGILQALGEAEDAA
jgi:hypothetical protein